jgi:phosphoribosylglycinamide formyltransferase 1
VSFDAAFLDRDGTLVRDPGYLSDPGGVSLLPGAAEAVRLLNERGILAIVVTNQSGIGRGLYAEADFLRVQREVELQLAARGARLDGVYHCPHAPGDPRCECRKPGTELFRLAARERGLRLHRCLFLGDRARDVAPGLALGGIAALVASEGGGYDAPTPDGVLRAPDLLAAVRAALEAEAEVTRPFQLAVFVSGSGTNLQALLDRFHGQADAGVRVSRVVASRAGIGAIERALAFGVPWAILPAGASEADLADAMLAEVEAARADLAILAGFLRLVPAAVVRALPGRILNVHPALLPAFGGPGMYGRRVHEAVLGSGARVSGVTVHVVDEHYDHGAIVAQWPVPVLEGDDPERLAARVLKVEHRLLPDVVAALAAGDLSIDIEGRPRWARPLFTAERFRTDDPA